MAHKHTTSIANVAVTVQVKWPVWKQKRLKFDDEKSKMVIVFPSGMSHSTIHLILENNNQVMEAVKWVASLKATGLTKNQEGPASDMEKPLMTYWRPDTEANPCQHHNNHNQSKEFVVLKETTCSLQHYLQSPRYGSSPSVHQQSVDKTTMGYLHNGILLSHKKEQNFTFCNSMDGPGEYYAKWNKPVTERQIPYDFTQGNLMNKLN